MAYNEIVEGSKRQKAARQYILDSVDDLDTIPSDEAGPGSMAIIPSVGQVYFMTPAGTWTAYGAGE